MKKNVMMRIASVLLVAVLLSTCVISGTFAKYTHTASSEDTARVAKWGFGAAEIDFEDLFLASYGENIVEGSNEEAVIAPGTSGTAGFRFALVEDIDKPEVAYTFSVSTGDSYNATVANTNIKWRLTTSADAPTDWNANDTWANLLADIVELSGDESGTKEYGVEDNLPAIVNTTYYVHWNWAFNGDADMDNALGNDPEDLIVTLEVIIEATQIDPAETPSEPEFS